MNFVKWKVTWSAFCGRAEFRFECIFVLAVAPLVGDAWEIGGYFPVDVEARFFDAATGDYTLSLCPWECKSSQELDKLVAAVRAEAWSVERI